MPSAGVVRRTRTTPRRVVSTQPGVSPRGLSRSSYSMSVCWVACLSLEASTQWKDPSDRCHGVSAGGKRPAAKHSPSTDRHGPSGPNQPIGQHSPAVGGAEVARRPSASSKTRALRSLTRVDDRDLECDLGTGDGPRRGLAVTRGTAHRRSLPTSPFADTSDPFVFAVASQPACSRRHDNDCKLPSR